METANFFQRLKNLLANGNIEQVISILKILLQNSDKLRGVLMQGYRKSEIDKYLVHGMANPIELLVEKNKVANSLLEIIDEIEGTVRNQKEIEDNLNFSELNQFISLLDFVSEAASQFKVSPVKKAFEYFDDIEKYLNKFDANSEYEAAFPEEASILNRLFGASIIFKNQDPSIKPHESLNQAFPFFIKSYSLAPRIWDSPHEESAIQEIKKRQNLGSSANYFSHESIKEYLISIYTAALVMSSKEEVEYIFHEEFWSRFVPFTKKPEFEDLRFFYESPIGDTDYKHFMEALKLLIKKGDGQVSGPKLKRNEVKNETSIEYHVIGKTKSSEVGWIVSKEKKNITPINAETSTIVDQYKTVVNEKGKPEKETKHPSLFKKIGNLFRKN